MKVCLHRDKASCISLDDVEIRDSDPKLLGWKCGPGQVTERQVIDKSQIHRHFISPKCTFNRQFKYWCEHFHRQRILPVYSLICLVLSIQMINQEGRREVFWVFMVVIIALNRVPPLSSFRQNLLHHPKNKNNPKQTNQKDLWFKTKIEDSVCFRVGVGNQQNIIYVVNKCIISFQ
jgi:hypothetical protein